MNKPMHDLVVARYKEHDLTWLQSVPSDYAIYLYDKTQAPLIPIDLGDTQIIYHLKIDDIGGNEAATYLMHIIRNYGSWDHDKSINDDSQVAFVQAFPFDHDPDLLIHLHHEQPIDQFLWLSKEILRTEWDGHPQHGLDIFVDNKVEGLHPDWLYCAIMGCRPPDYFLFGQGGMHMVKVRQILTKPKHFYEKALRLILTSFKEYKPWCGMERIWERFYLDKEYE